MGFWDREVVRTYGATIKAVRTEAKMTKSAAAAALSALVGHHVPEQFFTTWESGDGFPPRPVFARLDQALGLKEGELRLRAGFVWAERKKLLDAEVKAAEEADTALREDGRPPRGRRRPRVQKKPGS